MTYCRNPAHAHFGARIEHRLEVLRDVSQWGNIVAARAHEYEATAVQSPEVRPLKLGPCFFKSRKRPSSRHMKLPQVRHSPHALRDVAASVEYAPAKFGDLAYAVVEYERSQAAAEETELGYVLCRQLGYPCPDILPYLRDKLRKNQRVSGREDGCRGLVRDHAVARFHKPPYREKHLFNRSAVRADEKYSSHG